MPFIFSSFIILIYIVYILCLWPRNWLVKRVYGSWELRCFRAPRQKTSAPLYAMRSIFSFAYVLL